MENTGSTNVTCPRCGHSIDWHRPDEDAIIDACWGEVFPVTDEGPEGLCECSLRPSEIAGALLAHAREDIPALVAEVERLRTQLADIKDLPAIAADMLNAWHSPSNPHTWTAEDYRGLKHYGQRDFDGMVAILSAALGGEQR